MLMLFVFIAWFFLFVFVLLLVDVICCVFVYLFVVFVVRVQALTAIDGTLADSMFVLATFAPVTMASTAVPTTGSKDDDANVSGAPSLAIIVVAALGAVVAIALLAIGLAFCRSKRARSSRDDDDAHPTANIGMVPDVAVNQSQPRQYDVVPPISDRVVN